MCVILDANTWGPVFNKSSKEHPKFAHIHEWIYNGNGRIVYGGAKYKEELSRAIKYLRIFNELGRIRKTVKVSDNEVDQEQKRLENMVQDPEFDDAHLVAIIIVSGCRFLCSNNKNHYHFFKDKKLYPKRFGQVKIYNERTPENILSDEEIKKICRLCRTKQ